MKLTEAQEEAVNYEGRNLQLIACAGSGKTEVVAQRVAHLLTKNGQGRLEPRNVVAFTFTEKAAAELKERIMQRTREAAGGDITGMADMYVGTIHGFCQQLLQDEVPEYLKYEVLEPVRLVLFVNRYSAQTGLTTSSKLNGQSLKRFTDTGIYLAALSVMREEDVNTNMLGDCSVIEGLDKYRSRLAQSSYFDFSMMLEKAVAELADNQEVQRRIGERVKYVVVDEYQDVNPVQEKLVRILHDLGAGLCVVGDDDQTIYQWRGSEVKNILDFQERYPDVKQVFLEDNFRSSEGVIEAASDFVQRVEARLSKSMKFANAQPFEFGDVVALNFDSPEEEAEYISETIDSLHCVAFDDGNGERGLSWSDMAVLLRSVKGNGTAITDSLKKAGIPFVVTGLTNLFETDEAQAARDLFYFMSNDSFDGRNVDVPELRKSWERAYIGFTDQSLCKALEYVNGVRNALLDDKGGAPTIQALYLKFLELAELREENVPGQRGETVLFNLGRFSEVISDWESINYRSNPLDVPELRKSWERAYIGFTDQSLCKALEYVNGVRNALLDDKGGAPTIQALYLKFLELAELREENVPGQRGETVLFNLGRFSEVISDWESINYRSNPLESFQGFANFLYFQAADSYGEGSDDVAYAIPDAVQVMTVHQAKGREWPVVFLPALLRNRFPSPSRKSQIWNLIPSEAVENSERYNGSLEDERRLFYVAMTRSKKFLHMTWAPVQGSNNRYRRKSQFWDDVLSSKLVRRRKPDYGERKRLPARPKATIENVEFSFTDLKYLLDCSYQFKLRVLYGFNSPIVPPFGYGKSLHDALAEVHRRAMRGEPVNDTIVPELVERHLRIPYASPDLLGQLEQSAKRDIANYIHDNAGKFNHIEFSEQPVEIHLDNGVSIRGRIDLVRRTDTNETTIVDLKSNEGSQEEQVTELQLHTYALGYRELTGRNADYVEIYELAERNPIPRSVDDEFIEDVRRETQDAAIALRKMQLNANPGQERCRRCDFSMICSSSQA